MLIKREPHKFCVTPKEKCTMNYCDDNGCLNAKQINYNDETKTNNQ